MGPAGHCRSTAGLLPQSWQNVSWRRRRPSSREPGSSWRRHLGAALGEQAYAAKYAGEHVSEWTRQLSVLCEIGRSYPNAAHSAYTKGFASKVNYFLRTIEGMERYLGPLDEMLQEGLAPVLLSEGRAVDDDLLRASELPNRLGGLGLRRFADQSDGPSLAQEQYRASKHVTRPLVELIEAQQVELKAYPAEKIRKLKNEVAARRDKERVRRYTRFMASGAPESMRRAVEKAAAIGASAWLASLPIKEWGMCLSQEQWADVIALRFGQPLRNLPVLCGCGTAFSIPHGLECKTGGFINARHNDLRDFFISFAQAVFSLVRREPKLRSLSEDEMKDYAAKYKTPNLKENPRGDFSIVGLFREFERCFMDVRVWNHLACSYLDKTVEELHDTHEQEKNRVYKDRIVNYENGSFLAVVFNTAGSASPGAELLMKRLALQAEAVGFMEFGAAMAFMRTRVSMILAKAASECIRGTHVPKDKTEMRRAKDFARRRGCAELQPMMQRRDKGAFEDFLRLTRVPHSEPRPAEFEQCPCPPALSADCEPCSGPLPHEQGPLGRHHNSLMRRDA